MIKKKGWITLASLSLVLSSMLTACGSNNSANGGNTGTTGAASTAAATTAATDSAKSNEKVEISISTWGASDELAVFKEVLKGFEAANPNIKVKLLHIPNDYSTKMNTMISGGTAPDVLFVSDGDFPRWVKQGAFLDIQDRVEKSDKIDVNDMWETGLNRYKFDGNKTGTGDFYALPKDIGPTVMYYNKAIFDKYGVPYPSADKPMTWDEALAMWQKLTVDTNNDGKTDIYGSGPIWWEGYVWSNGGKILSDDRKEFTLNQPEGAEALQHIYDLTNKYKVVPDARVLQSMNDGQMFEAGKLATITAGRWMVPTYRKLKFDWDVAPIPAAKEQYEWNTGWSGSVGFGINAKTKHPDEAFKLVEYFAGTEGQTKMTELGFQIPNFKSMSNTDVFLQKGQKPEHAEVFINAAKGEGPGMWTYLPNGKWSDTLNQALGTYWKGTQSAQDFLNDLKPKVDAAIKQGNPELFK